MTNTSEKIAKNLLEIEAVALRPNDPFIWASGLRSPIYCDNRLTMSYPDVRDLIAGSFVEIIEANYPDVEVIAGTATAGIPHAAWVAEKMNLPMIYIRGKAKEHGKGNQIEGMLNKGQKVVLIEDLISTGGSVLEACDAVEKAKGEILGVAAIFSYLLPKAQENFTNHATKLVTLSNYDDLVKIAVEMKIVDEAASALLTTWRKDPENWGK